MLDINHCANYNNKIFFDEVYEKAEKNVSNKFPNYKKNLYFYTVGLKGLYLLFFNKQIANLLFKLKHKGGSK